MRIGHKIDSTILVYDIEDVEGDVLKTEIYNRRNSGGTRPRAVIQEIDECYVVNGLPSYIIYKGCISRVLNHSFVQGELWSGFSFQLYIRDPYYKSSIRLFTDEYREDRGKYQICISYPSYEINSNSEPDILSVERNTKGYIFNTIIMTRQPNNVLIQQEGSEFYIYRNKFVKGRYFSTSLDSFMNALIKEGRIHR